MVTKVITSKAHANGWTELQVSGFLKSGMVSQWTSAKAGEMDVEVSAAVRVVVLSPKISMLTPGA
jgi:hypothetical protein